MREQLGLISFLCKNSFAFIVGDDKQSIYIWRDAYPKAFKSIWGKENFVFTFIY